MRTDCVGSRWRRGVGLLVVAVLALLTACAARKKPRTSCGLSRTNDSLNQWYAKYQRNPALLRATVEPMLRSATAAVKRAMAAGGIDSRPNAANARMAVRRARRYVAEGYWDRGLRWSYLALAVLPRAPALGRLRLALVLQLARSLYALKAYRASALYAMYYQQQPLATRAGKADASDLLSKLHKKLLWSSYMARYGAAVSGLPLAKQLGLGQRPVRRPGTAEYGPTLRRLERSAASLRCAVRRRLRRDVSRLAGEACRKGTLQEKLARAKVASVAAQRSFRARQWKKAIASLMVVRVCRAHKPVSQDFQVFAMFMLARSHDELRRDRASALFYLAYLTLAGSITGLSSYRADQRARMQATALKRYRELRSGFGLKDAFVIPKVHDRTKAGSRCPP